MTSTSDERALRSWKEIASALGRDVRTVRRWEARGLPVHRVPGDAGRSTIYAYRSELESWLKARPAVDLEPGPADDRAQGAAEAGRPSAKQRPWALLLLGLLLLTGVVIGGLWWNGRHSETHRRGSPQAVTLVQAAHLQLGRGTPDGTRNALDLLKRAVAADPNYAPAHASLASAYVNAHTLISGFTAADAYPRALAEAEKAYQLDPNLAQSQAMLGNLEFYWNWDFPAGLGHLRDAVRLDPDRGPSHYQLGQALLYLGDVQGSLKELRLAAELEPEAVDYAVLYASARYAAGEHGAAIADWRSIVSDKPNTLGARHELLVAALAAHDWPGALTEGEAQGRLREDPRTVEAWRSARRAYDHGGAPAMLASLTDFVRAETAAGRAPLFALAELEALDGDSNASFAALERSLTARESSALALRVDPILEPLRKDPKYEALIRQFGLSL